MSMGPGFSAAVSSLQSTTQEMAGISSNIANAGADGTKGVETFSYAIYSNMSNGQYYGISSGVQIVNKINVNNQGTPIMTDTPTNMMIVGPGMFPVTNDPVSGNNIENVMFTRVGDFEIDKNDTLVNGAGNILLAWKTDSDGNIPQNNSTIQSLQPVSIQQAIAGASATTEVAVELTLNSSQTVVGFEEGILQFDSSNLLSPYNANITKNDIIYPDSYNALTVGEGLSVQLNGQIYPVIYGGFAQTISLDPNGTNLVADGVSNFAGDVIDITVDNFTLNPFVRGSGTTNLEVLQNLATQINATNGPYALTSRIVQDLSGNVSLLIAPQTIDYAISFDGSQNFRIATGLTENSNTMPANNTLRFASMQNLSDIFNSLPGVSSILSSGKGVKMNLSSINPMFIDNYNPLGGGSNFLREFGLGSGYLDTSYNPYDQTKNMAGGGFNAHYTRDFTIYDSLGTAHSFLIRFLKVDTNKWAVEVHAINPTEIQLSTRTDGLLMAGYVEFDGNGNLLSIDTINQPSISAQALDPSVQLGATDGQTFEVQAGNTTYVYNYSSGIENSNSVVGSNTELTTAGSGGSASDTLDITINGTTFNFARGNGATDLDVLNNLASQINNTVGLDAMNASVIGDGAGNYVLSMSALDIKSSVSFASTDTGTPTISSVLNFTNVSGDQNRFSTLYELSELINQSTGIDGIKSELVPEDSTGTLYSLSITPLTSGQYLQFTGSTGVIGSPLSNGASSTIAQALGMSNTSQGTAIAGLKDTMIINWSGQIGAAPNSITVNWGDIGSQDGLNQVAKEYSVQSLQQNGVSIGELVNLQIDEQGFVIANFSNGTSRQIYKIAIAYFDNMNALTPGSGGVFYSSDAAGALNLKAPGTEGAGTIESGVRESSNIDTTAQLSGLSEKMFRYQAAVNMLDTFRKINEYLTQVLG